MIQILNENFEFVEPLNEETVKFCTKGISNHQMNQMFFLRNIDDENSFFFHFVYQHNLHLCINIPEMCPKDPESPDHISAEHYHHLTDVFFIIDVDTFVFF